jgi:hypothetical protein
MGTLEDLIVLRQIALGFNDIDTIASAVYPLRRGNVRSIISQLSHKGLVKTEKGLCLSTKGLLELSRQIVKHEAHQSEYLFWSINGLPFFKYENKLHKEVITHPNLFFEPASPYFDDEKQIVYETSLLEIDFNIENI